MYCELPELRRCCFCLPLRRGVLILAYVNIVACVLETWLTFTFKSSQATINHQPFSAMPYELDITLLILDIVATILLVVGLHMKRELLVRIFYYFMIFSLCASVPLTLINASMLHYNHFKIMAFFNFIFTLVIDLYLLLLVRSLVKKLQVSDGNTFGNQLAEFIEGSPTSPDQNGTVTITIRDEIVDSTKP